jgi:O-antigen ligase
VIVFGFVLAFSRGGAISFFLMIVIMVFLRFIRTNHFLWIIGAAALLLIIFPEYVTRIASIQSIQGFISPEESSSEAPDGAIEGRATEMLAAILVFVDHPVLGVGPDMFRYYSREYGNKLGIHAIEEQREAHSLYLDIAANNGILGLVGFLGIVVVTLVELFRVRKRWLEEHPDVANIATSFIMANVAYLATGIFLHLSYIRYFWLLMALSSAVILVSREMEKAEEVTMPVNRTERLGR